MSRHHHGHRPVVRPVGLRVLVERVKGKGVEVRLVDDRSAGRFWLPLGYPASWPAVPEVGEVVTGQVPRWMAERHRPIVALRSGYQASLGPLLNPPPPLGPEAYREGSFPVTDSNDLRGALFKNDRKEKDTHPDYRGDITIEGRKFWLSGWIKEGKKGKYLSLAAKPVEEQRQQAEPQNAYAATKGRQASAGGPTFRDEDAIPFAAEWR